MPGLHTRFRIPQRKLVALAVLAACSWSVQALTLGRLVVLSGTGEALRAEIDILEYTPQELMGLSARIAPPASFQAAGMEYNPGLESVSTRIAQRSNGRPYISLTGQTPLRESFIDVILEAQWNTGRTVKNYALLLNAGSNAPVSSPSGVAESQAIQSARAETGTTDPSSSPTPAAIPRSTDDLRPASVELNARQIPVYRFNASPDSRADHSSTASSKPSMEAPALRPRRTSAAVQTRGAAEITVRPGDTLSQIAMAHLPPQVSLDQMMVAIQQANPGAFIESNVNLVKAGTVLLLPDAQQAASVSRDDARRLVVQQTRAFMEYSRRIAQAPLRIQYKSSGLEVSGKVETAVPPAPAASASQDTLTLSKGSVSAASEEARLAADKEVRDTDAQVAAVTKTCKTCRHWHKVSPLRPAKPPVSRPCPPLRRLKLRLDPGAKRGLKQRLAARIPRPRGPSWIVCPMTGTPKSGPARLFWRSDSLPTGWLAVDVETKKTASCPSTGTPSPAAVMATPSAIRQVPCLPRCPIWTSTSTPTHQPAPR